jgi:hypothetical protein
MKAFRLAAACAILLLASATQGKAALIVYEGDLTGYGTQTGQVIGDSLLDPALFDYWTFDGTAGVTINLRADRLEFEPDLIMSLFFGHAVDTTEFDDLSTSSFHTWLVTSDDVNNDPFGGPYADPEFQFILPSTGTYTILVAEHTADASSPGPFGYTISLTDASVPEPATLAVFGVGASVACLGAARRRRLERHQEALA